MLSSGWVSPPNFSLQLFPVFHTAAGLQSDHQKYKSAVGPLPVVREVGWPSCVSAHRNTTGSSQSSSWWECCGASRQEWGTWQIWATSTETWQHATSSSTATSSVKCLTSACPGWWRMTPRRSTPQPWVRPRAAWTHSRFSRVRAAEAQKHAEKPSSKCCYISLLLSLS